MAGLTEEDLNALLPQNSGPAPGEVSFARADAIRDEIYRRHGIDKNRSLQEAIDRIEMQAKLRESLGNTGGSMGEWANPEERGAARAEYAKQGKTPEEAKARLEESIHLLDPESRQYMQRFGRDLDFLKSEAESEQQAGRLRTPRRILDGNAIRYYDGSAGSEVARKGTYGDVFSPTSGGYQRFGGWGNAAMNVVGNPETGAGGYLTWAEIPANALLTSMGGETQEADGHKSDAMLPAHMRWAAALARGFKDSEAWDRARAAHSADANYRPFSPSPVADFPAGSKPSRQDSAARILELQRATASAQPPMVDERWHRTTGGAPPSVLTQPGDSLIRSIDPSVALTAGLGARALATLGRAAVRPLAVSLGNDQLQEQALNAAITAGFGGEFGRSQRQFWLGGGTPGVDFKYKSPEELAQARKDARVLGEAAESASERVSRADAEAYQGAAESGALGPNAQMRARMARKLQSQ